MLAFPESFTFDDVLDIAAQVKLQPTHYQTLLTSPTSTLWARCDDRPDVSSIAILGYN
jgi:hypothetical protein